MATAVRGLINGLAKKGRLPAADVNLISNTLEVAITDLGRSGTGHVRMAANANDADTVTITVDGAAVVYEFESGGGVGGGNVAVTIGGSAAATATNLRAAVNTNQGTVLASAVHGTNTTVVDLAVIDQGDTLALAESTAGARVVVQDNAEEAAEAATFFFVVSRTVTAEDVTRGRVRIDTRLTTILTHFYEVSGADWDGAVTESGGVLEFDNTGSRDFAASDIIRVLAFGRL